MGSSSSSLESSSAAEEDGRSGGGEGAVRRRGMPSEREMRGSEVQVEVGERERDARDELGRLHSLPTTRHLATLYIPTDPTRFPLHQQNAALPSTPSLSSSGYSNNLHPLLLRRERPPSPTTPLSPLVRPLHHQPHALLPPLPAGREQGGRGARPSCSLGLSCSCHIPRGGWQSVGVG